MSAPDDYPMSSPEGNWAKLCRDQLEWCRRHGVVRPEKGKIETLASKKSHSSEDEPA